MGSALRVIRRTVVTATAEWVGDPSEVHIDHIVALAEAWRSGADSWTTERRQRFANDLSRPQLIAVSAEANLAKLRATPIPPNGNRRTNAPGAPLPASGST